jgi:AAA domain
MISGGQYVGLIPEQEQERAALYVQYPEVFSNKWTPAHQQAAELYAAEYSQTHPPDDEYSEEHLDHIEAELAECERLHASDPVATPELAFFIKYGHWPERYYRLATVDEKYGKFLIQVDKLTPRKNPEDFVQMIRLADGTAEKVEEYKKKHGGKMPENVYSCSHNFTIEDANKVLKNVVVGKHLNIHGAASFETRKIKWLWPRRVPLGKLTLFVGVPGGGKSLAAGDVAAKLSTGRNWFDAENLFQPSETLMLVGEDDIEDTTIPRLQAAGADLKKIHFLKSVITEEGNGKTAEEREFQFDKDLAQIEEFLQTHSKVRLIVVDPVSNYMGSAKMNSEQEVRSVLIPLKNLAERMNVALIGIMHLNKKTETDAINRVGGAMAFVGVARMAYLFQEANEQQKENGYLQDQHFMVLLKGNITKKSDGLVYEIAARPVNIEGSPEFMPYIKFTSTTTKSADGVLQPKSDTTGRPPSEITKAKEWLKDFLKEGRQLSSDVKKSGKELANLTSTTLDRAKVELGVMAEQDGRKWYWYLPIKEPSPNMVSFEQPIEDNKP